MTGLIKFFRGSLKISGKDGDVLMLASEMTRLNIPFSELSREDEYTLSLCAPYKKREQIALLSKKLRLSLVIKVSGLVRLAELYKKRVGLFVGAALALALILFSNMFILSFEVVGNERLSESFVLSLLEAQGLKAGTFKKSHDLSMLALNSELLCDDIAWLSVNISGTKAVIELRETKEKPDIFDDTTPTDIVAKCDGQIIYTEAVSGSAAVRRYDVVKAGDLLISGVVDSKAYGYKLVRSRGRVIAKTYRSFTVSVPLEDTVKEYTGKKKTVRSVNVFGKTLLNAKPYSGFSHFDVTETKKVLRFFGSVSLPVVTVSTLYREYALRPVTLTQDEARRRALAQIADIIADEIGDGKISERTERESVTDEEYTLTVDLYCIEDISSEKPIDKAWGYVIK